MRANQDIMAGFSRFVEFRRDGTRKYDMLRAAARRGNAAGGGGSGSGGGGRAGAHERVWMRYTGDGELAAGGGTTHHALHECALALGTDYDLLDIALWAHGHSWGTVSLATSLDHSVWFHAPARADEWLLFDVECPRAAGARALVLGRVYTARGVHVATVAQEGLLRVAPLPRRGQAPRL